MDLTGDEGDTEMTTTTGSEKQVAWATDLRAAFVRDMTDETHGFLPKARMIATGFAQDAPGTDWTAILGEIEEWYQEALAISDAQAWIESRTMRLGPMVNIAAQHGVKMVGDNPFSLMQRMGKR